MGKWGDVGQRDANFVIRGMSSGDLMYTVWNYSYHCVIYLKVANGVHFKCTTTTKW